MHDDDSPHALTRRRFLELSAAGVVLSSVAAAAPAIAGDDAARPVITSGVQAGDVELDRAVVWCRADRPARLRVRYGTTDALMGARERVSSPTSAEADFTARLDLTGLPPGQRIVYEARFEGRGGELSEPVRGAFRTPARTPAPVRIVWGGDVCGQGWGIDEAHGGMKSFASMRAVEPDLFIHSGDLIYADGPIAETVTLDTGGTWRNLVADGVGDVAQTLDQFRGRYRYNFRDAHLRAFNAEVPIIAQWDDHEVLNNWYPTELLGAAGNEARYSEKQVSVLAARAKQAFFDCTPIRADRRDPRQVYRVVRRGPLADVFVLDCRSYRGPNSPNLQAQAGPETAMLGATQRAWPRAITRRCRSLGSRKPVRRGLGQCRTRCRRDHSEDSESIRRHSGPSEASAGCVAPALRRQRLDGGRVAETSWRCSPTSRDTRVASRRAANSRSSRRHRWKHHAPGTAKPRPRAADSRASPRGGFFDARHRERGARIRGPVAKSLRRSSTRNSPRSAADFALGIALDANFSPFHGS